jgi:hypothetical protein
LETFKMELIKAQELYNQHLCIFPDCSEVSSKIPVKQRGNLNNHIKFFNAHNTPGAVAYKQRLIGGLTYNVRDRKELVLSCLLFYRSKRALSLFLLPLFFLLNLLPLKFRRPKIFTITLSAYFLTVLLPHPRFQ